MTISSPQGNRNTILDEDGEYKYPTPALQAANIAFEALDLIYELEKRVKVLEEKTDAPI